MAASKSAFLVLLAAFVETGYCVATALWWQYVIFNTTPEVIKVPTTQERVTPPAGLLPQLEAMMAFISAVVIAVFLFIMGCALCKSNLKSSRCATGLYTFLLFSGVGLAIATIVGAAEERDRASNTAKCVADFFSSQCNVSTEIARCTQEAKNWCEDEDTRFLGTLIYSGIIVAERAVVGLMFLCFFIGAVRGRDDDEYGYDSRKLRGSQASSYYERRRGSSDYYGSREGSYERNGSYYAPPPPPLPYPEPPRDDGISLQAGDLRVTVKDDGNFVVHT